MDEKVEVQPIENEQPSEVVTQSRPIESDSDSEQKTLAVKEFHKKSSGIKQQREIIHAREEDTKLSSRLGDLVVPLIALGILVLIVSFVFVPFSTEIVETRKQTKSLLEDIRIKEEKVATLKSIDVSDLESNLRIVSKVVQDQMDVSELAMEVEYLALKNGLNPESQSASNSTSMVGGSSGSTEKKTEAALDWKPEYADSIMGPFSFSGSFENVCAFINDLRLRSSTVLSLGEVTVSHQILVVEGSEETVEVWSVDFDIKGYMARPATSVGIDDPVVTQIDENLMREITNRSAGEEEDQNGEDSGEEQGIDGGDDGDEDSFGGGDSE